MLKPPYSDQCFSLPPKVPVTKMGLTAGTDLHSDSKHTVQGYSDLEFRFGERDCAQVP